jgi:hypothetical protein
LISQILSFPSIPTSSSLPLVISRRWISSTPDPHKRTAKDAHPWPVDTSLVRRNASLRTTGRSLKYFSLFCLLTVVGYQVAQVRTVFIVPRQIISQFLSNDPDFSPPSHNPSSSSSRRGESDDDSSPIHLAYPELFTRPVLSSRTRGLYTVKRIVKDQRLVARIIPLSAIVRSVHLFSRFGAHAPAAWTSSNVLEDCSQFFINNFSDRHMFTLLRARN